ncbi:MAG: flagellar biosynthetic protein FliR [Phycisphaerales bacterium]
MNIVEIIQPHIIPALLVICRIGGLMIFGPVLSTPMIPARIRVGLAFLLGLAIYPALIPSPLIAVPQSIELWMLAAVALIEVSFGAVIGLLAGLPIMAAQMGGLVMGQQMGLGFARFFNPAIDDEADVIGQVLYILTIGAFIAVGGVEQLVYATLHSFQHVALGGFIPAADLLDVTAGLLLAALEMALRISAPLLGLIFLETVAMGFLAKTVPQLNILSLGFPIRILAGLFILAAGLLVVEEVLIEGIDAFARALFQWIEGQSSA